MRCSDKERRRSPKVTTGPEATQQLRIANRPRRVHGWLVGSRRSAVHHWSAMIVLGVLVMSVASVAAPAHAQEAAMPLLLRASYFDDLGVDPLGAQPAAPSEEPAVSSRPEELERRIAGARSALVAGGVLAAGGIALIVAGATYEPPEPQGLFDFDLFDFAPVYRYAGGALLLCTGVIVMGALGARFARDKRELQRLHEARDGAPRRVKQAHEGGIHRVRWDVARSRLVF